MVVLVDSDVEIVEVVPTTGVEANVDWLALLVVNIMVVLLSFITGVAVTIWVELLVELVDLSVTVVELDIVVVVVVVGGDITAKDDEEDVEDVLLTVELVVGNKLVVETMVELPKFGHVGHVGHVGHKVGQLDVLIVEVGGLL